MANWFFKKGAKIIQWENRSLQMVLGQVDMREDKPGPYFTPPTKINSKWTKTLKIRAKLYKTLRRKHRHKYSWAWIRQWFLSCDTKSSRSVMTEAWSGCCQNGQVYETREGGAGPGWTLLRTQSGHHEEHWWWHVRPPLQPRCGGWHWPLSPQSDSCHGQENRQEV